MKRHASITSVGRALLLSAVIILACHAKAYAQTDIAAVKAVISPRLPWIILEAF